MSYGNQIKTVILLGALTGIFLGIGWYFGGEAGVIFAFVFAAIMNLVSYFWSDKIVLKMYKANPADPHAHKDLHRVIKELCHHSSLPIPKLYIINSSTPNAFATGRNPENAAVAVTTGIMNLLSKDELKGVIAHELSHIKNRDILIASIAATIAGAISLIASMSRWSAIFGKIRDDDNGSNIIGLLALAILTPIIALIIQLSISRSREYLADSTGAKLAGTPYGLASALEKLENANKHHPFKRMSKSGASLFIVNPFSGQTFISLFSTHPPTKERIRKLRSM